MRRSARHQGLNDEIFPLQTFWWKHGLHFYSWVDDFFSIFGRGVGRLPEESLLERLLPCFRVWRGVAGTELDCVTHPVTKDIFMSSAHNILVLGIGNILWADEGFGVRCVESLAERYVLPDHVTVMDGGTQGLYLLPYVEEARRLLVFDAVDYGDSPGTLRVVVGDEVPRFMGAKKMSLHQTGFQEVLASAELLGRLPDELLLIGCQPVELDDFGGSLRAAVKAQIAPALEVACEWLTRWGAPPVPREGAGRPLNVDSLSMAAYEAGRPSERDACRTGDARFLQED